MQADVPPIAICRNLCQRDPLPVLQAAILSAALLILASPARAEYGARADDEPGSPSLAVTPTQPDEHGSPALRTLTRKADEAVRSLIPSQKDIAIDVVRVAPGKRTTIYCRTRIAWIEFANKIPLEGPLPEIAADDPQRLASQLRPRVRPELLTRPILSKHEVDAILQRCHPGLRAPETRLRAPFFNNWTGIHWDPSRDYLGVEANAIVDIEENHCTRGIVDLRTGDLRCFENMPCVVE